MGSRIEESLRGYSLPLSPSGLSSVALGPPWHFGVESISIRYRTHVQRFRQHLPHPFELSDEPGLMEIVFCEMASVSAEAPDQYFENPERVNFRECLVRMSCMLDGRKGWYVPYSWVDSDFSLMRGIIQGFPKRLGYIHMTRFGETNPLVGGRRRGARLGGRLVTDSGLVIKVQHVCETEGSFETLPPEPFFLIRHFPDIEDPARPAVHEVVEPVVENVVRGGLWVGPGKVEMSGPPADELTLFEPLEVQPSRSSASGFTITGGRVVRKL